ncbi:hypothetical protein CEE45_07870 [Candidatus Heimdallarchaeota archaeon B3_Heim]|nr:MAG: hypothetical protein CEE45_07870 [Candidatus Heimdallarchaeota archaeon B3_Heim]
MSFALGTPINARIRPWKYDWIVKPDSLMISAIDLMENSSLFEKIKKIGVHEYLEWDGPLVCDSGAFSAINRKKKINVELEQLKLYYRELTRQDPNIIKITLDYPDENILSNYLELLPYEIQPVIPYNQLQILEQIVTESGLPEWSFIGRLVPLMRGGSGYKNRLFSAINDFKNKLDEISYNEKCRIWALGVGAPSILTEVLTAVDGCDSSRWRITGSNMILLPHGGERGVGNKTKWRGTHRRIEEGDEKMLVLQILQQIDTLSGGLETLDKSLWFNKNPKQLKNHFEVNLPSIGKLIEKLRNNIQTMTVYDLELLLRSSGNLRLIFNYFAALHYKLEERDNTNYENNNPYFII